MTEDGLEFYRENGYERFECPTCGSVYWTLEDRGTCTDAPCSEYRLTESGLFSEPFGMDRMRQWFIDFFAERGHTPVEPYPVVARWRDDVYLTIASIAVFQPHVTTGAVPPPANPLVISQPCIRLNDLPSVGRTGRHVTTFEMMANHAFNEAEEIYWIDGTLRYAHEMFTSLGVPASEIVYKENPWVGGGNGGEAVEVIIGGLELATLVFMHYAEDPDGDVELKGQRFSPMPRRIVDTGYGLERFVWASSGAPTIYDAVVPDLVAALVSEAGFDRPSDEVLRRYVALYALDIGRSEVMTRLAGEFGTTPEEIDPPLRAMEDIYTIADHLRTLVRMLGDGIVPSNAKAGYLARLVLRRAERLRLQHGISSLSKYSGTVISEYMPQYADSADRIVEIVDLEAERFATTMEKGRRLVERQLSGPVTTEDLIQFYDTYGIPPDVVAEVGAGKGIAVEVPEDFLAEVADRHSSPEPKARAEVRDLPATRSLYYEAPSFEFDSKVLAVDGDHVMLAETQFYPDGGGQPGDEGYLGSGGQRLEVVETTREGAAVLHRIPGHSLKIGDTVHGVVDAERRMAHARHHTATHLIIGSARRVLGRHVWQAGSQLDVDGARLDITHHRPLTDEEIRAIERSANRAVLEDIQVTVSFMERNEADRVHGHRLYQGGPPAGPDVRIVAVGDFEVQACGGTHVERTGQIGMVRITGTERIQDGVERLHFSAGLAALDDVVEESYLLHSAAEALNVQVPELPKTAERFFNEWKDLRKRSDELSARLSSILFERELGPAERVGGIPIIVVDLDEDVAMGLAKYLVDMDEASVAVIGTPSGRIVVASNVEAVDAKAIVGDAASIMGGGGGGNDRFAQGGGPDREKLAEAIDRAVGAVRAALKGS